MSIISRMTITNVDSFFELNFCTKYLVRLKVAITISVATTIGSRKGAKIEYAASSAKPNRINTKMGELFKKPSFLTGWC